MEPTHSLQMVNPPDGGTLRIDWYDGDGMPYGVTHAARHIVQRTKVVFGDNAAREHGAVEFAVNVSGVGTVYLVVAANGTGAFVVHATRDRGVQAAIFADTKRRITN